MSQLRIGCGEGSQLTREVTLYWKRISSGADERTVRATCFSRMLEETAGVIPACRQGTDLKLNQLEILVRIYLTLVI